MTFDDLVFDRPSAIGGKFYALTFFNNGLGVHVHSNRVRDDLYEVSVVKGTLLYWETATHINTDLGIREFPMNAEEVTASMARVAAL